MTIFEIKNKTNGSILEIKIPNIENVTTRQYLAQIAITEDYLQKVGIDKAKPIEEIENQLIDKAVERIDLHIDFMIDKISSFCEVDRVYLNKFATVELLSQIDAYIQNVIEGVRLKGQIEIGFMSFDYEGNTYYLPKNVDMTDIAALTRQEVIEVLEVKRLVDNLVEKGVATEEYDEKDDTTYIVQKKPDVSTTVEVKLSGLLQTVSLLTRRDNEKKPDSKIALDSFIKRRTDELEHLPAYIALKLDAFFFAIMIHLEVNLPAISFLTQGSQTIQAMNMNSEPSKKPKQRA